MILVILNIKFGIHLAKSRNFVQSLDKAFKCVDPKTDTNFLI